MESNPAAEQEVVMAAAEIVETMTGARLPRDSTVDLCEVPVPRAGPGQVLLRMAASTICGSDLAPSIGDMSVRSPTTMSSPGMNRAVRRCRVGTRCSSPASVQSDSPRPCLRSPRRRAALQQGNRSRRHGGRGGPDRAGRERRPHSSAKAADRLVGHLGPAHGGPARAPGPMGSSPGKPCDGALPAGAGRSGLRTADAGEGGKVAIVMDFPV